MVDQIQNKALSPERQQQAANAARRLLELSRDAELEGPWADACRGLAHDALALAGGTITDAQRAVLQAKLTKIQAAFEVKA